MNSRSPVSGDIRLIVHKTEACLLLCCVDHHDTAYRWAERRKLETHPKTGVAQLVEIRETPGDGQENHHYQIRGGGTAGTAQAFLVC